MKLTQTQKKKFRRLRHLSQMKKMDPIEFEHFVGWLYQRKGYRVSTTQASADQGIDLVLHRWGRKTIVQVKRYKGNVGQPIIRDLYGAMMHEGASEAHLVTTGTLSKQAENWIVGKPIILVDGNDLVSWVNKGHRLQTSKLGQRSYLLNSLQIGGLILSTLILMIGSIWIYSQYKTTNNTLLTPTTTPYVEITRTPTISSEETISAPAPPIAITLSLPTETPRPIRPSPTNTRSIFTTAPVVTITP